MDKVYCKGWGTVYVTDDLFDGGNFNPWDQTPTFWTEFVAASLNIPTLESCGYGGLKVVAPLLGGTDEGEERGIAERTNQPVCRESRVYASLK